MSKHKNKNNVNHVSKQQVTKNKKHDRSNNATPDVHQMSQDLKTSLKEHPNGKLSTVQQRILIIIFVIVLIILGWYLWRNHTPEGVPYQPLSEQQQTSLIKTETKAVKHNAKPNDVIGSLLKRQKRLSTKNQKLSSDLIYTSVQNATLYYNNAAYMMGGEIDYSRPAKSTNSLDGRKDNAWLQGFLAEIERQHLVAYNYSASQILILPDFKYLQKQIGNTSDKELSMFLQSASEAQDMKVFTTNEVNMVEAANAYQTIMIGSLKLAKVNHNSKYLQDFASLARIYHDLALGFGKDNNLIKKGKDRYQYSKQSVNALHIIGRNKNLLLQGEAQKVLSQLNTQDHTVSIAYLNQESNVSAKTFGTSVYWQNQTDISAILNGGK